jgi:hypothetical protein
MKVNRLIALVILLIVAGGAFASVPAAMANENYCVQDLSTPVGDNIQAPPEYCGKFGDFFPRDSKL